MPCQKIEVLKARHVTVVKKVDDAPGFRDATRRPVPRRDDMSPHDARFNPAVLTWELFS